MNNANPKPTHRPRWRFEFRLRTLFLLTALVACPLGYVMYERHRCDQQQLLLWRIVREGSPGDPHSLTCYVAGYTDDYSIPIREGMWSLILGDNSGDRCTRLEIGSSQFTITRQEMRGLAHFRHLQTLDMRDAKVEIPGFQYLASLSKLEELYLARTTITDESISSVKDLGLLVCLDLHDTIISDQGASHLAALTNLKTLYLQQTQVSDAGLKHLSKLKKLEHLDLSDTLVTAAAIEDLSKHTQLKFLALPPDSFPPIARTEIRKRLSSCDVIFARN